MIFDTHAHYDDEAFDDDREQLLERMRNRGVEYIVNVGASMASCKSTIGLIRRFPYVYGALGVHPDEVAELTDDDYNWLAKSVYKPKIVAVGEIGLDYHWNDNREQQIAAFERQMDIARKAELPIIIHSRDAAKDTYDVMKSNKADEIGGVIHCFSYTKEMAKQFLDMGFYLGKYIYLLDAWDDLQEDFRTKSYNPFLAAERQIQDIGMEKDNRKERVRQILTEMISRACYHFERLPVVDNVEILRNILYSGVWTKFDQKKSRTDKKEWREEG